MKIFRTIAGLLISILGLWFALRGTDWPGLRQNLQIISQPWWLAIFVVYVPFEFLLRTRRWTSLLAPLRPSSALGFFPVTAAAFFLNNVLPFRAGEAARVYWTHRKTALPLSTCFSILVADRLFDMMALLTIVSFVLFSKSSLFSSPEILLAFSGGTLTILLGLLWLARWPESILSRMNRPWVPSFFQRWLVQFASGALALRTGKSVLFMYGLSILFWTINVFVTRHLAHVFGLEIGLSDAGFLMAAYALGVLLPSAPGYVGTLEAAGVAAFAVLGFGREQVLPFILATHACQILSTLLWGLPSLWAVGLKKDVASPGISSLPAKEKMIPS